MESQPAATTPGGLYLDLLKKTLTRYLTEGEFVAYEPPLDSPVRPLWDIYREYEEGDNVVLVRRSKFDHRVRAEGLDWPAEAETMIGLRRLDNLQQCIEQVLTDGVPGDLIEAGVWRGGAVIFMRGVLAAHGVTDRVVWAADSFQGLPKPDPTTYPADMGDKHWTRSELAVSLDQVKSNFDRYGLLDDQVRFLAGWFRDTLPNAPMEQLAIVRIDGDMYESTMVSLESLYPKLEIGGFVIIDDFNNVNLKGCRRAVEDFRLKHAIDDAIEEIDWTGVYWRRSR